MSHNLNVLCGQLQDLSLGQLVKLLYAFDLEADANFDFRDLPHMWGEESYKNHTEEEIKDVMLDAWYSSINDMTQMEAVDELAALAVEFLKLLPEVIQ